MQVTQKTKSHLPAECLKVSQVLARVGDKWSVLIVTKLGTGPRRFSELLRSIDSISQRMLTLTLRGLERDGLVKRCVVATIPPRVDYQLTELGESLREPVTILSNWALTNLNAIDSARAQYDVVHEPPHAERRSGVVDEYVG